MIPKFYIMKGVGKALGLFQLLASSNVCKGSDKRNRRKHKIPILYKKTSGQLYIS